MRDWLNRRIEGLLDNAIFGAIVAGGAIVWSILSKLPAPVIFVIGLAVFALILFILKMARDILSKKPKDAEQKPASPVLPDFEINWNSEQSFLKDYHGGYHLYNNTNEEWKTALVVKATIRIDTLRLISIQSIALEIGTQLIPWGEVDVNVFGESITDEYEFTFPLTTPRGKQLARIKAIIDGQEYTSPKPFIIDFPRKSN